MDLTFVTLADRPDLLDPFWDMETSWPEYMLHDPIGNGYYASLEEFTEYVLVGLDATGRMVAKAHSVPFVLPEGALPDAGWDFAIRSGLLTRLRGEEPDAVSAVEIAIEPGLQGTGLSAQAVAALRDNAARLGHSELLAPVRPNGKTDVHEPMADYAFRTRDDGLPVDPWLRVHVRAGGRIDRVAPRSMVIPGTVEGGASGPACRSTRPVRWRCRAPSRPSCATPSTAPRRTSSPTSGSGTRSAPDLPPALRRRRRPCAPR